ncbi:MAG: hypothetical protein MI724_04850 [Spirochaetales bacterium]|nr:hypothetical protein [Spirochaetales bacterium]
MESLAFGEWTITASALNGEGIVIGSGGETVTVITGETVTAAITVVPIEGVGTLDLTVTWNEGDIQSPSIDAELVPTTGVPLDLAFTIDGAVATYTSDTIATGYHTLSIQLLDNGIVTAGAVEVARIVDGAATSGDYLFDRVNQEGGAIDIVITPELADPLTVSIAGGADTVELERTLSYTASVAESVGAVCVVRERRQCGDRGDVRF